MPLVTTTPYKDPCDGQVFIEGFESGDFSNWDYSSPSQPTIVSSPVFSGSWAMRIQNGTSDGSSPFPPSSGIQKVLNLGTCPTTFSFKFLIAALGVDDPSYLQFDDGAANYVGFIPARQASSDPARRMLWNGVLYSTLSVSTWYQLNVTNINWTAGTWDFELLNINAGSPGSVVDSATSQAFGLTNLKELVIVNEAPGDSIGATVYDDITIS